jgi:hypothetical protein
LNNKAAGLFYQSAGSLTSAMRRTAESINAALLERNLSTTGRGQYALGLLVMAAMRNAQCTLLLSGPTHAVWISEGQSRDIHDAALSGKGLGSSQSIQTYFSQVELHPQDLLVLCGKFPTDWEADLLNERPPASLDASYRKLTFTKGDLNAALIQVLSGHGTITLLRPDLSTPRRPSATPNPAPVIGEVIAPESFEPRRAEERDDLDISSGPSNLRDEGTVSEEELDSVADFAAHMVQPSAYSIPPQPDMIPLPDEGIQTTAPRGFPSSIPRAKSPEPRVELEETEAKVQEETRASEVPDLAPAKADRPSAHAEATRQMAKAWWAVSDRAAPERAFGNVLTKVYSAPASEGGVQETVHPPNIRDGIYRGGHSSAGRNHRKRGLFALRAKCAIRRVVSPGAQRARTSRQCD